MSRPALAPRAIALRHPFELSPFDRSSFSDALGASSVRSNGSTAIDRPSPRCITDRDAGRDETRTSP